MPGFLLHLSGNMIHPEGGAVSLHVVKEKSNLLSFLKALPLSDRQGLVKILCSAAQACWTSSAKKDVQIQFLLHNLINC